MRTIWGDEDDVDATESILVELVRLVMDYHDRNHLGELARFCEHQMCRLAEDQS